MDERIELVLARELPSINNTQCYKEIRVPPKIRVGLLPSRRLKASGLCRFGVSIEPRALSWTSDADNRV